MVPYHFERIMLGMKIDEASNEMKDVLARCEENIPVSLVEINEIPEIKNAEERLSLYAEKLVERVRELTGVSYEKFAGSIRDYRDFVIEWRKNRV